MRWMIGVLARGGVAAFFFFSWIIQLLWNAILVDQLALVAAKLDYWQAAGFWFLVSLLFAWTGIAARPADWLGRRHLRTVSRVGKWMGGLVGACVSEWSDERDRDKPGDPIEARIRRGVAHWLGVDDDTDWEDLGERIARRIRRAIRKELRDH